MTDNDLLAEVSDTARYIDHRVAAGDRRPALGQLPLGHGELLPAGALDDEPPDEDRRQIARHALDMHHVTDRTGSPQTLVCRKTREIYSRQCLQHAEDIAAMRALLALAVAARDADRARLAAAVERQPQAVES